MFSLVSHNYYAINFHVLTNYIHHLFYQLFVLEDDCVDQKVCEKGDCSHLKKYSPLLVFLIKLRFTARNPARKNLVFVLRSSPLNLKSTISNRLYLKNFDAGQTDK